jgi:hypothetical protein|nr:MAG TPA: hypothetical protein [Caudoviricetes sp.]
MEKFSKNTKTNKDKLLESFSVESGLPIEACNKLYESLGESGFKENIGNFLSVNLGNFANSLKSLMSVFKDAAPESINNLILNVLSESAEKDDSVSFFKVILYLLLMKDKTNFTKIADDMNIDEKIAGFIKTKSINLFESVGLPSDVFELNINNVPVITGFNQGTSVDADVEFYSSLKHLLSRNNKRWGNNYHLERTYDAIQKYLDEEIKYIQNKDAMYTVDSNFENDLIRQLLVGTLPVMYRDINVLRPLISDIQTLTFDMICLFMGFVKTNNQYMKYINRNTTNRMINSFSVVYAKLLSSKAKSHVLLNIEMVDTDKTQLKVNNQTLTEIFSNTYLKDDISKTIGSLDLTGAVDILYIIKSCSQDFEIRLRPYLREFVTAGFEYLAKYERIYCELIKTNKYKNTSLVY